ncbi:MAG: hypothetical protein MJY83_05010 [Bacteroidales bacterium]|nr:hypothetical protein [Bacteroidales bacterium]
MFNPRFPHTLTVLRGRHDAEGNAIFGEDGDPIYEVVPLTMVEMFDEEPLRHPDGSFVTYDASSIPFGYRTDSRSTATRIDVVVSDFKLATPMCLTELYPTDVLVVKDYEREYRGRLVKKTTFNLGTNIWMDEIRN